MDESGDEDLFASPSAGNEPKPNDDDAQSPERPEATANQNARYDAEEAKEAALRRELEGVRNINQVIEGVIATLDKANGNMDVGLVAESPPDADPHPPPGPAWLPD